MHNENPLTNPRPQLETQLEALDKIRTAEARSVRTVDRTVKDLQQQLERRDKSSQMLTDDLSKSRDKIERLLQTIDELQTSDSATQLACKRVERELREEREKNLRLERELERVGAASRAVAAAADREGHVRRSGAFRPSLGGDAHSRRGSSVFGPGGGGGGGGDIKIEVPARKSSLTKGFL